MEQRFLYAVWQEFRRAKALYPDPKNPIHLALTEEVGEVSKAIYDIPQGKDTIDGLHKELVQTAAMAMRLWVDGDATYPWTKRPINEVVEKSELDSEGLGSSESFAKGRPADLRGTLSNGASPDMHEGLQDQD